MKKVIKKCSCIICLFLLLLLTACGGSEGAATDVTGTDVAEAENDDWREVLVSYMKNETDETQNEGYQLIYIDNDDIPEIVEYGKGEAIGSRIVYYGKGTANIQQLSRLGFSYIEKSGLLDNRNGNMGHYYDRVYKLENGDMQKIADGTFGDKGDTAEFDENGDFVYAYQWENEDVSKEEYNRALNEIYDTGSAIEVDGSDLSSVRAIITQLKGVSDSAETSSAPAEHFENVNYIGLSFAEIDTKTGGLGEEQGDGGSSYYSVSDENLWVGFTAVELQNGNTDTKCNCENGSVRTLFGITDTLSVEKMGERFGCEIEWFPDEINTSGYVLTFSNGKYVVLFFNEEQSGYIEPDSYCTVFSEEIWYD